MEAIKGYDFYFIPINSNNSRQIINDKFIWHNITSIIFLNGVQNFNPLIVTYNIIIFVMSHSNVGFISKNISKLNS